MNKIVRPENLATLLMRHIHNSESSAIDQANVVKLDDFVNSDPTWQHTLDVGYLFHVASQLVNQGLLADLGGVGLERMYLGRGFLETDAIYGAYENQVGGPIEIFRRHSGSVFPVLVKDSNNDYDLGTGFFLGNANTFVTARHVVENMQSVKVLDAKGKPCSIQSISYHANPNVDLAVFLLEAEAALTAPPFRRSSHVLGESILSIGFPPVPGFDRLTVLEHGEIGSEIKVMNGEVVSGGLTYQNDTEYFLVNARVKGGSSGAPVLNRNGFVVGVVASTALSAASSDKLDGLGYGIITPASRLGDLPNHETWVDVQFEKFTNNGEISTAL